MDVSENSGTPWYPQIIHFNVVFQYKPSILGYPYFWKHPYFVHLYHLLGGLGQKTGRSMGLEYLPTFTRFFSGFHAGKFPVPWILGDLDCSKRWETPAPNHDRKVTRWQGRTARPRLAKHRELALQAPQAPYGTWASTAGPPNLHVLSFFEVCYGKSPGFLGGKKIKPWFLVLGVSWKQHVQKGSCIFSTKAQVLLYNYRCWFRILSIFTVTWGDHPIWWEYVSNGLKSKTNCLDNYLEKKCKFVGKNSPETKHIPCKKTPSFSQGWDMDSFPGDYPPWKLRWNLKMMVSNRNLLFQGFIFRFHVSFPGRRRFDGHILLDGSRAEKATFSTSRCLQKADGLLDQELIALQLRR